MAAAGAAETGWAAALKEQRSIEPCRTFSPGCGDSGPLPGGGGGDGGDAPLFFPGGGGGGGGGGPFCIGPYQGKSVRRATSGNSQACWNAERKGKEQRGSMKNRCSIGGSESKAEGDRPLMHVPEKRMQVMWCLAQEIRQ